MSVGWSPQIAVVDTSLRDVVALRSLLRLPNGFGRADTCRLRETAKVTPDSKPSRYSKRGDVVPIRTSFHVSRWPALVQACVELGD